MTRKLTSIGFISAGLLAGCGGHAAHRALPPKPKLPRMLAAQLASLSDTVAQQLDAGDGCGALATADNLQSQALAAVADGQVPPALRRPLTRATTQLQSRIVCVQAPSPPRHGKHGEHGKGNQNGQGGGGD